MDKVYIGVDIGSATVKVAGISRDGELIGTSLYLRHDQFPSQVDAVKNALRTYLESVPQYQVGGIGLTGSGRELNRHMIGGDLTKTEIFAHSVGIQHLIKKGLVKIENNGIKEPIDKIGTIIEIGGQDSKVIVFDKANVPVYFNMNTICSAGTGEFLKQIADEAGISLNQFGPIALEAMQSARIDSTCTVFSRRDFRHLTQKGVPLAERLAGICDAMVTNYLKNVVKDVPLPSPIVFQGGVAFNQGVKRAFEHHLGVEVIIPPYHDIVGALGMAAIVLEEKKDSANQTSFKEDFFIRDFDSQIRYCHGCQNACELSQPLEKSEEGIHILDTLGGRCEGAFQAKNVKEIPQSQKNIKIPIHREKSKIVINNERSLHSDVRSIDGIYFAGIDGGSRGTKYALIKGTQTGIEIISVGSVETSGDAIKAIQAALIELKKHLPLGESLGGVGTTGSAGELARDMITTKAKYTSDVKVTEILAHTTWAQYMVPGVKVIMDIGGNDAKIIVINDHGIEFAMNDKCAAGAGAFIEAIAKRFEIPLDQFGPIALTSHSPARISGRCAVFGESDIIHKARAGFPTKDLLMGLAYSICRTYLSDIGKGKVLSVPIVAQGGTFLNQAIQHAFKETLQLSEEEFIIAKDRRLVVGAGALGAALLAKDAYAKGMNSSFKGFDTILSSTYHTRTLTCKHPSCDRTCHGVITLLEDDQPIAGYKSINCDFGLFEGMIEDDASKKHIETLLLERGLA
ncbi:acyl-CoA dehydratase activase [Tepidibacillus sp. HK-1]|uniref:acyl-CoA dehydratase activase n=1 Tax=Tepidibacillus sp. HK-1 TaxID=1883407 RepID=UPI000852FAE7|nr:acyl-CoA dehydratase activase [Tepidibacillus sp. HK-1]GBF10614.1 R-phenyllactate dehydratase activator [Tepidibacillus sp. HK-1]